MHAKMTREEAFKEQLSTCVLDKPESRAAWEKAWRIGLPTRKSEGFEKHDLKRLLDIAPTSIASTSSATNSFAIVHGGDQSGIEILSLQEAKRLYSLFLQNLAKRRLEYEKTIFPMLNEACCQSGMFLSVTGDVSEPLWLDDVVESELAIVMKRLIVYVAKGKQIDLILDRTLCGKVNENVVIEVVVEEGASCRMIELECESHREACSLSHVRAQVKRNGVFRHYSATHGGALLRHDLQVYLLGEGSEADLQGIWLLDDHRRSHTEVRIEHCAPHTRSNQHYKGVLQGWGQSTFEGKIYVHAEAQKTEAYQLNNNLLLERGATAFVKPNLEIFADDVKASHGATVTQLSEEELFYLQTRGISRYEAKVMLTRGFVESILHQFFDERARKKVRYKVSER